MPSFKQFTHLRLLTLSSLDSYETLLKLLDEFHHLYNLTHLNLYSCSFSNVQADYQSIVDNIWRLPRLVHLYFGITIKEQQSFCVPTILSSSLKYVSISRIKLKLNQIHRLFDYTPHLKHLSAAIESFIDEDYVKSPMPMLTRFDLSFLRLSTASTIDVLFQNMPNLRHLDVTIRSVLIDGYQWEQIMQNYLPKLKTLRLKMKKRVSSGQNIHEEVNELIDSFRSSFWIDKHQWFVRCFTYGRYIHLCTLSDSFDYPNTIYDSWKSTYPHDNHQILYNNMTVIYDDTFFDRPISSDIRLSNITYLRIKLPINDQFWSIVPNLNQLKSLTVSSHTDIIQSELQTLIDRIPHLHTLSINQLSLQMSLFKYINNTSIRVLDVHHCNHRFNEEECITWSQSSLGVKCEVLAIRVNNRESIINLVKNMNSLRTLIVYWNDEENCEHPQTLDQLVRWLKDRLISTCLIVNDSHYVQRILIWI